MSAVGQAAGRVDQAAPPIGWRTRANITLCLLVVAGVLAWHAAVALTAAGLGLAEPARTLRALLRGHPISGLAVAQPASTTVTLGVFAGLLALLFAGFVAWALAWGSWRARRRAGRGFAGDAAVRQGLGVEHARGTARQTRPGLTDTQRKRAPVTQIALPLGATTSGQPVVLPLEDHAVVVATTGAGKSRDLMIPAALDAPGGLVVTCTRADILDVIATRRAELGRVWVFDPLDRLGWPDPMVWNPVAGCRDGQRAISRGLAFAAGLAADDSSSTNVAPLCAMLLQEVVDAAKTTAARLPGGRIDPPLRLVGDEIANVAPLPKLPDLGTNARGFGMQLVLALQSLAQARRRWGADGAHTLLDNMPAETLLGGLTDTDALNRYATLVGDVELTRARTSYDPATGQPTTASEQLTDRKVLRADEARQIPDGHGLLIYRNRGAVLLRMTPWYQRQDGKALDAQRRHTQTRRAGSGDTQAAR